MEDRRRGFLRDFLDEEPGLRVIIWHFLFGESENTILPELCGNNDFSQNPVLPPSQEPLYRGERSAPARGAPCKGSLIFSPKRKNFARYGHIVFGPQNYLIGYFYRETVGRGHSFDVCSGVREPRRRAEDIAVSLRSS